MWSGLILKKQGFCECVSRSYIARILGQQGNERLKWSPSGFNKPWARPHALEGRGGLISASAHSLQLALVEDKIILCRPRKILPPVIQTEETIAFLSFSFFISFLSVPLGIEPKITGTLGKYSATKLYSQAFLFFETRSH